MADVFYADLNKSQESGYNNFFYWSAIRFYFFPVNMNDHVPY